MQFEGETSTIRRAQIHPLHTRTNAHLIVLALTVQSTGNDDHQVSLLRDTGFDSSFSRHLHQGQGFLQRFDLVRMDAGEHARTLTGDGS